MDQIHIYDSYLYKTDPPKAQDPTTVNPANNNAPPLEGENSAKVGGVWTLKHDTSSPK